MDVHPSVIETLRKLQDQAPDAPLLALGQTVFWDEPLKACLPLLADEAGVKIRLTAGVHDTDYFAKLPGGVDAKEPFVVLPKNDGSTKDFWSAAAEFSALFGSETPVTRETLSAAGVSLEKIARGDHKVIDRETEAWGWRGLASTESKSRVTREVHLGAVFETLQSTLIWAMQETVDRLSDPAQQQAAQESADRLRTLSCDTREVCPGLTLAEFYECLLPQLHTFVTGSAVPADITRTSKLLDFNSKTASLPRFKFVDNFINPKTAQIARDAYDAAVGGTEVYTLDRFGTGAIPFDMIIPGEGRGTVRLTSQMLIVVTPTPKFIKLDKPIESIQELAAVTDKAFGSCTLVGKAITLISMLASEFVFAFHEGASQYVSQTRKMHEAMLNGGIQLKAHPILRIAHETWDALCATELWLRLPVRLRAPFGAEIVSGPTFCKSWRCIGEQQSKAITHLAEARSTGALITALQEIRGGRWETLTAEYVSLRESLAPIENAMKRIRTDVQAIHERLREVKREWVAAEVQRGEYFRAGKHKERDDLLEDINSFRAERRALRDKLHDLREEQAMASSSEEAVSARQRRREITREAEHARLRCVQEAVMATQGLEKTNRRPAAWWLPVVSPDGAWFNSMLSKVQLRLEPLLP